jgi:ABC-type glycerol-3-phosphate transport system substrate-binding protein
MAMRAFGRRSFLAWTAGTAALLAACGGAAPPTEAPPKAAEPTKPAAAPASSTPAAAAPAKAGAGQTLQYWSFFPSDNTRWAERPAMFEEFKQKTGNAVEVNYVQDAQLDTKVQTGFAAKQLPDVIDPGITQFSVGWGRQGIVIDVSDVLAQLGKDDFAKPLVSALTYKGKLYGIPWQANPQMMFYRKDWAAEKGLKITNWDEWLTFAKTFTGKNPAGKDGYGSAGFMAPVHQAQWIQDWLGPNGGLTFDEKWTVVLDTQKQNLESFDYMKRMSAYFQPGAANNSYGDTNNLFNDQALAINLSSTTFVNGVIKNKPELADKIGIQPIPQGPSGKNDRGAYLGCYSFVVCSTSQQQDLARQFLIWLFDPAVYIRVFKTIDFGHIPTRVSVANDPKLATIVPPLAIDDIKAGIKAAEIATLTGEDFGPNPLARQITAQNIWTSMSQKVLAETPQAALKWAADEIRKIVKDSPADLG